MGLLLILGVVVLLFAIFCIEVWLLYWFLVDIAGWPENRRG